MNLQPGYAWPSYGRECHAVLNLYFCASCRPEVCVALAGTSDGARLRNFIGHVHRWKPPAKLDRAVGAGSADVKSAPDKIQEGLAAAVPPVIGRLRVVLAQLPSIGEDVATNVRVLTSCIVRYTGHADLVVAPECFISGFVASVTALNSSWCCH